ncbi:MAG: PEP-CTERM sorting domain-containing protein [Candidatus Thiodiazotropha sp. 6PLUC2]
MKTFKLITLFVWGGLSFYMQNTLALPVLYTFTGNVTAQYEMDDTVNVSVGDPISYSFVVDDEVSSWVNPEGRTVEYGHTSSSGEGWVYHSYNYYAEFVGGSEILVDENATGYNPLTGNSYGQFYAREGITPQGNIGDMEVIFRGYGSNGFIQLNIMSSYSEWQVDSQIMTDADWNIMESPQGFMAFDADLALNIVSQDHTGGEPQYPTQPDPVTPIEDSPANVPEPTTYFLVLSGLLGIGLLRKKAA